MKNARSGLSGVTSGVALVAAVGLAFSACSSGGSEKYQTPAGQKYSGQRHANVPPVPSAPTTPIKNEGGAYTVYGATHHFRSPLHTKEVTKDPIAITGYIVKANYDTVPECAQHPQGKEDPKDCPSTEVPSFYIGDNKGDTKGPMIRVINWAHNFSAVYDAMKAWENLKEGKEPPKVQDKQTGAEIPFPLPAVGAKVKVTGKYGLIGTNAGSERIADPRNGILMLDKIEVIQPAEQKAAFAPAAPKKKS